MELVAVDAHVEDVERAHRGPAVLVGERDRRQPVGLHLLGEGDELIPRLRDRVALLLPEALAVVDGPRVVLVRHEVLVPVEARRGGLDRRRHLRRQRLPDVVDRRGQALRREELHPVAGEPREDVVRAALQVAVDLVLERVVVDRVGLDLDARVGGELLRDRGEGLDPRVGLVRPERDGAPRAPPRAPRAAPRAPGRRPGRTPRRGRRRRPRRAARVASTAALPSSSRSICQTGLSSDIEILLGLGHAIAEQHTIEQKRLRRNMARLRRPCQGLRRDSSNRLHQRS